MYFFLFIYVYIYIIFFIRYVNFFYMYIYMFLYVADRKTWNAFRIETLSILRCLGEFFFFDVHYHQAPKMDPRVCLLVDFIYIYVRMYMYVCRESVPGARKAYNTLTSIIQTFIRHLWMG